jgi:hypothetical protein
MFVWYKGAGQMPVLFLRKIYFLNITFIFIWGMHIQCNDITPMTIQCYRRHPVTNKFYPFNYWNDSIMYEKSCP